jgi:phosphoribosylformylglycinamidine synthase
MCFPTPGVGLDIDLTSFNEDIITVLFNENSGVVLQVEDVNAVTSLLGSNGIDFKMIGTVTSTRLITIQHPEFRYRLTS